MQDLQLFQTVVT